MKKLKLNIDDLKVESFETNAGLINKQGTVNGNEYISDTCGDTMCDTDCGLSCDAPCATARTCEFVGDNCDTYEYNLCDL